MVANVTMEKAIYLPAPERFEAGSQPVAQAVGWARALQFLTEVGMDRFATHERELTAQLLETVSAVEGVRVLGPDENTDRLGVVAFAVEGVHPHDVGQILDADSIAVRVGHHCAIPLHTFFGVKSSTRASVALTTTPAEIEQLGVALEKVRKFFGKA